MNPEAQIKELQERVQHYYDALGEAHRDADKLRRAITEQEKRTQDLAHEYGSLEEKLVSARQALLLAYDALPDCRCGALATHLSLDAAGMGVETCDTHSHPGGMVGGEGPFPRAYVKHLKEALACLVTP